MLECFSLVPSVFHLKSELDAFSDGTNQKRLRVSQMSFWIVQLTPRERICHSTSAPWGMLGDICILSDVTFDVLISNCKIYDGLINIP